MSMVVELIRFEVGRLVRVFGLSVLAMLAAAGIAWVRSGRSDDVAGLTGLALVVAVYAGLAVSTGRDFANGAAALQLARPISREQFAFARTIVGGIHGASLFVIQWGMAMLSFAVDAKPLGAFWPWSVLTTATMGFCLGAMLVALSLTLGAALGVLTTAMIEFGPGVAFRLRTRGDQPPWLMHVVETFTRANAQLELPTPRGIARVTPFPLELQLAYLADLVLFATVVVCVAVGVWVRRDFLPRSE